MWKLLNIRQKVQLMLTTHNLINYQNMCQVIGNIQTLKMANCELEWLGNVLESGHIRQGLKHG